MDRLKANMSIRKMSPPSFVEKIVRTLDFQNQEISQLFHTFDAFLLKWFNFEQKLEIVKLLIPSFYDILKKTSSLSALISKMIIKSTPEQFALLEPMLSTKLLIDIDKNISTSFLLKIEDPIVSKLVLEKLPQELLGDIVDLEFTFLSRELFEWLCMKIGREPSLYIAQLARSVISYAGTNADDKMITKLIEFGYIFDDDFFQQCLKVTTEPNIGVIRTLLKLVRDNIHLNAEDAEGFTPIRRVLKTIAETHRHFKNPVGEARVNEKWVSVIEILIQGGAVPTPEDYEYVRRLPTWVLKTKLSKLLKPLVILPPSIFSQTSAGATRYSFSTNITVEILSEDGSREYTVPCTFGKKHVSYQTPDGETVMLDI